MLDCIIIRKHLISEPREFDIPAGVRYSLKHIEPSDPLFEFFWESYQNDPSCLSGNIGLFRSMKYKHNKMNIEVDKE